MFNKISDNYSIQYELEFKSKDYYLKKNWHLRLAGKRWIGYNMKEFLNGIVINKLNKRNDFNMDYCYIDGYEANVTKVFIHIENIMKVYFGLYYPES